MKRVSGKPRFYTCDVFTGMCIHAKVNSRYESFWIIMKELPCNIIENCSGSYIGGSQNHVAAVTSLYKAVIHTVFIHVRTFEFELMSEPTAF